MKEGKNLSAHYVLLSHWRRKNTTLCAANLQRCILLDEFEGHLTKI